MLLAFVSLPKAAAVRGGDVIKYGWGFFVVYSTGLGLMAGSIWALIKEQQKLAGWLFAACVVLPSILAAILGVDFPPSDWQRD